MNIPKFATVMAIAQFGALGSTAAYALPNPAPSVEAVAAHLEGVMDTSAQAAADSDKANVRMTTCRVRVADKTNPNSVYLYQEQALNESLDSPYRQRFLAISRSDRQNTVVSHSYRLQNAEAWNGFCDRPLAERVVAPDLFGKPVCSVFLKQLVNVYQGTTQPGGCPTNFRGADYITNNIILHDRGMDTWDRGFDAEGNQVWGADETGYQYRWSVREN